MLEGLFKPFPAIEKMGIDNNNCLSFEHLLLFPLPKPKETKQFPSSFDFKKLSHLGVDNDTIERFRSYDTRRLVNILLRREQTADLIRPFFELLEQSGTKNLENLTLNQIEGFVDDCTQGMGQVVKLFGSSKVVPPSPQDLTDALDALGILKRVEANRKHIQETVNQLIATTFKGMLLPNKEGSLSIVEHTPQEIAEYQKLDQTGFSFHYFLNDSSTES